LSLKIKYIEIDGIDTSSHECHPCIQGFSKEGSSHCELCKGNTYFNHINKTFDKCPEGQIYKKEDKCVYPYVCQSKDYYFDNNDLCNNINNKQKLVYKIFSSINCVMKDAFSELEIDYMEYPVGKYFKYLQNNNKICEYCPEGTFTNKSNSQERQICEGNLKG